MISGSASSVEKFVRSKNNFGSAWTASKDCFGSIEAELDQAADDKIALSSTQREEMEAEISTSVLMIERSECSLIWAAEAKGEVIDFRPTTSPQAVLGVRLDRQPDQEAPRHLTHQFRGNRSAVEDGVAVTVPASAG